MSARRLIEKTKQRLDKEIGAVYKSHVGKLRVALAFPNTYYVGMSSLGFQTVYKLLNDREDVVCERVFIPDQSDIEYITTSQKPLFTMESQTPVRGFDVLVFSISYELDYPNVLKALTLSGLNEKADERDRNSPLVIAGGPAVTFNPEILASFIDVFVIGEAEEVLPEIMDALQEHHDEDRAELLLRLAGIEGVYVPRFYETAYKQDGTILRVKAAEGVPERIRRRWVKKLDAYTATSAILTPETEFSNMILAEVSRGCGRQCRFCIAGYAFLPPRARTPSAVLGGIQRMEEKVHERLMGHPRIGLISASVFDHPSALLICQSLLERDRLFSISSTRADTLSRDIAETLHRGGQETLTIAPEAGSDRLRRVMNKCLFDEEILGAAASAWDGGFRRLKLYFMIGLPTETDEDIKGITGLVSRIAGTFGWEKLTLSVSCFVPKPWTPFQWSPMEAEKSLAEKIIYIRNALKKIKRVEVTGESARESVVQGALARGDRRVGDALLISNQEKVSWKAAFRKAGIDPCFYAQRQRNKDEIFPWDHLDLGVKKQYLRREYERAIKELPTPACVVGECRRCGVC